MLFVQCEAESRICSVFKEGSDLRYINAGQTKNLLLMYGHRASKILKAVIPAKFLSEGGTNCMLNKILKVNKGGHILLLDQHIAFPWDSLKFCFYRMFQFKEWQKCQMFCNRFLGFAFAFLPALTQIKVPGATSYGRVKINGGLELIEGCGLICVCHISLYFKSRVPTIFNYFSLQL